MFRRNRNRTDTREDVEVREGYVPIARGGVSFGAILTGVVVSLGTLVLLYAIVGGILVATGTSIEEVSGQEAVTAGIATGIALVVAQFLAYMWGGYTAGRMGRGAGFLNGLLVPLMTVIILFLVGAVAAALGAEAQLNIPFDTIRLPLEENAVVDFGVGIGIAALVAMFLGGILGGLLGARWHTKLERRVVEERAVESPAGARSERDDVRAAEERRRLAERAEQRRRADETAPAPPPPGEGAPTEPVVTDHGTSSGTQRTARTAPPPEERTGEKPSLKDRLTGKG